VRRLHDLIVFAGLALLATGVAAAFVWLSFVLAVGVGQAIAGTLGEALAAVLGTVLLVIGCLIAAQVAVWARGRWAAREGAGRVAQRQRDLDALRRDPARSHWAPLAGRLQVADARTVAQWESRYRALREDPRRRAFAAEALRGNFLTDEQIDLLLDADRPIVCAHLRPVEQALRARCAPMSESAPGVLFTPWTLEGSSMIASLHLDGVTWDIPPSHPRDPEPGRLVCAACRSRIESGFHAPPLPGP
jgi:hypothetical protein